MALTSEYIVDETPSQIALRSLETGAFVLRLGLQILGASLILSAALLWLAPGVSWSGDIILIKAVLSVSALIAGTAVFYLGQKVQITEIEIDTIRRELRVVSVGKDGVRGVQSKSGFADLHKVEQDGPVKRLWKDADTMLAEVSVLDRRVFGGLLSGLRDAGKIS